MTQKWPLFMLSMQWITVWIASRTKSRTLVMDRFGVQFSYRMMQIIVACQVAQQNRCARTVKLHKFVRHTIYAGCIDPTVRRETSQSAAASFCSI